MQEQAIKRFKSAAVMLLAIIPFDTAEAAAERNRQRQLSNGAVLEVEVLDFVSRPPRQQGCRRI